MCAAPRRTRASAPWTSIFERVDRRQTLGRGELVERAHLHRVRLDVLLFVRLADAIVGAVVGTAVEDRLPGFVAEGQLMSVDVSEGRGTGTPIEQAEIERIGFEREDPPGAADALSHLERVEARVGPDVRDDHPGRDQRSQGRELAALGEPLAQQV